MRLLGHSPMSAYHQAPLPGRGCELGSECKGPGREISLASLPGRKEGSLAKVQTTTRSERAGSAPADDTSVIGHGSKFGCSCSSRESHRRN